MIIITAREETARRARGKTITKADLEKQKIWRLTSAGTTRLSSSSAAGSLEWKIAAGRLTATSRSERNAVMMMMMMMMMMVMVVVVIRSGDVPRDVLPLP